MVYLIDNPPARSQYRSPRSERPSGVMVVHTAENTPDTVATDGGAEAVANFIRTRTDPGSYHDLVDSDSAIQLVRYSDEAYQDATGSNPHAWGGSIATTAAWWPVAPPAWRDGAIRQLAHAAARYAHWIDLSYGIVIPARRITRAESEARVPGFISHAERDPARRSDPGAAFPWDQFLAEYAAAVGGQPLEDDMTPEECEIAVRKVLNEAIAPGQTSWAGTAIESVVAAQAGVRVSKDVQARVTKLEQLVTELPARVAAEVVATLPEGSADAAVVEAAAERGLRKVLADAGTPDESPS